MSFEIDDIDRAMMADDTIVPSSGFASGVMDAVRTAATALPPLAFPWLRFAIGVAACLVWAAAAITVVPDLNLSRLAVGGEPPGESWQLLQWAAAVGLASIVVLRYAAAAVRSVVLLSSR